MREKLFERAVAVTKDIHDKGFDHVIFLDKSARPLSWIVRTIWKEYYKDEIMPKLRYLNLGSPDTSFGASESLPGPNDVSAFLSDLREVATTGWVSTDRMKNELAEFERENPSGYDHSRQVLAWALEPSDVFNGVPVSIPKEYDAGARHIAIIDDFVKNGITLSRAIAYMQYRNPEALVEGTGFFASQLNHDRELMPWLWRQDIGGVRDMPSTRDRIFTHAANAGAVERYRVNMVERARSGDKLASEVQKKLAGGVGQPEILDEKYWEEMSREQIAFREAVVLMTKEYMKTKATGRP